MSILPGFCLRYVIQKVPGVGQGNHVQFFLTVVVHKCFWLIFLRYIYCAPCPLDCMQF